MKRCLFIDDSSVIRKVARRILGGSGLLVLEAGTGGEAIDLCASDMPEIVVVDGALPDMPSTDVIRRIRSIQSPVKPLIAICLTEVDIGAIMRARRAGAQDYILKPFNRAQLLDQFRTLQAAA